MMTTVVVSINAENSLGFAFPSEFHDTVTYMNNNLARWMVSLLTSTNLYVLLYVSISSITKSNCCFTIIFNTHDIQKEERSTKDEKLSEAYIHNCYIENC